MKRVFLIGGGVVLALVVIVVAVGVYVFSNLDSIVKTAIEEVGSEVTQTKVSLNDVELSLSDGSGALRGFTMANPQGFSDNNVVQFNEVSIALDLATVQSDPVVIKEIIIDGPQIIYELGEGGSNIEKIQENVAGASQKQGGGSASSDSGSEGPKLVIENLILRNGKVSITATQLLGQTIDAPLPEIHLKDIGKESNGATPGEIAVITMDSVLAKVTTAVGSVDISKLTDQLNISADDAKKLLEQGGGATKAVEEGAGGAVEDAGKALKGILGN